MNPRTIDEALTDEAEQRGYERELRMPVTVDFAKRRDYAFYATVTPTWTTLHLPNGDVFAFRREDGEVLKLPHPEAPFALFYPNRVAGGDK